MPEKTFRIFRISEVSSGMLVMPFVLFCFLFNIPARPNFLSMVEVIHLKRLSVECRGNSMFRFALVVV